MSVSRIAKVSTMLVVLSSSVALADRVCIVVDVDTACDDVMHKTAGLLHGSPKPFVAEKYDAERYLVILAGGAKCFLDVYKVKPSGAKPAPLPTASTEAKNSQIVGTREGVDLSKGICH